MSIPISQFILPSTPPPRFPHLASTRLFSTSVSPSLPCKLVHLHHFSRFHIYALIRYLFFPFWLTSLCMTVSKSIQMHRLSNRGSRAQLLHGMWDLPRPGLEPVSPALAGRFSTTAPPGKPQQFDLFFPSLFLLGPCQYAAILIMETQV